MKSDQELLEIFENKEKTTRNFWIYNSLTKDEKMRLFDLINNLNLERMRPGSTPGGELNG